MHLLKSLYEIYFTVIPDTLHNIFCKQMNKYIFDNEEKRKK